MVNAGCLAFKTNKVVLHECDSALESVPRYTGDVATIRNTSTIAPSSRRRRCIRAVAAAGGGRLHLRGKPFGEAVVGRVGVDGGVMVELVEQIAHVPFFTQERLAMSQSTL